MDIYAHIKNQLAWRGFDPDKCSMQFARVTTAETSIDKQAYNEYWYLDMEQVPGTLKIESDTHTLTNSDAASYNNFSKYRFHEFSGLIRISAGVAIDLGFIRVMAVPMEENKNKN